MSNSLVTRDDLDRSAGRPENRLPVLSDQVPEWTDAVGEARGVGALVMPRGDRARGRARAEPLYERALDRAFARTLPLPMETTWSPSMRAMGGIAVHEERQHAQRVTF